MHTPPPPYPPPLQIPLDGSIAHGRALVSSEHITGESLPVVRRVGEEVPAGAVNHDGLLVVRAMRVAEESTPARIAQLALDAQVHGAGVCVCLVVWVGGWVRKGSRGEVCLHVEGRGLLSSHR
jgi:hypothetical protein